MARSALLHLLKSQSTSLRSGDRLARVGPLAYALRSETNPNSTNQFSTVQRRFLSQPATVEEGNGGKSTEFVYYGPISSTIRKVKALSLSTCFLSTLLGPIITFVTYTDTNVILKGAVASSAILFSASTTAALHWFASPYVHKLTWQPGSDSCEVDMLSWLATYKQRTIKFADIRPSNTNRPYVLFEANGKYYFIDEENCSNKVLMAKLTPWRQGNEKSPNNS